MVNKNVKTIIKSIEIVIYYVKGKRGNWKKKKNDEIIQIQNNRYIFSKIILWYLFAVS